MLVLVTYDVSTVEKPGLRRLRRVARACEDYGTRVQKSVFECFLTEWEKKGLIAEVRSVMDVNEDRFMLMRLDPRCRVRVLGIAVEPIDPEFFYVG